VADKVYETGDSTGFGFFTPVTTPSSTMEQPPAVSSSEESAETWSSSSSEVPGEESESSREARTTVYVVFQLEREDQTVEGMVSLPENALRDFCRQSSMLLRSRPDPLLRSRHFRDEFTGLTLFDALFAPTTGMGHVAAAVCVPTWANEYLSDRNCAFRFAANHLSHPALYGLALQDDQFNSDTGEPGQIVQPGVGGFHGHQEEGHFDRDDFLAEDLVIEAQLRSLPHGREEDNDRGVETDEGILNDMDRHEIEAEQGGAQQDDDTDSLNQRVERLYQVELRADKDRGEGDVQAPVKDRDRHHLVGGAEERENENEFNIDRHGPAIEDEVRIPRKSIVPDDGDCCLEDLENGKPRDNVFSQQRGSPRPILEVPIADALEYLQQVQQAFHDQMETFEEFAALVKEFAESSSTEAAKEFLFVKVEKLFQGRQNLTAGFKTFLSDDDRVGLPHCVVQQQLIEAAFHLTLLTTKMGRLYRENERDSSVRSSKAISDDGRTRQTIESPPENNDMMSAFPSDYCFPATDDKFLVPREVRIPFLGRRAADRVDEGGLDDMCHELILGRGGGVQSVVFDYQGSLAGEDQVIPPEETPRLLLTPASFRRSDGTLVPFKALMPIGNACEFTNKVLVLEPAGPPDKPKEAPPQTTLDTRFPLENANEYIPFTLSGPATALPDLAGKVFAVQFPPSVISLSNSDSGSTFGGCCSVSLVRGAMTSAKALPTEIVSGDPLPDKFSAMSMSDRSMYSAAGADDPAGGVPTHHRAVQLSEFASQPNEASATPMLEASKNDAWQLRRQANNDLLAKSEPGAHDVVLGQGPYIRDCPGNVRFRALVAEHKHEYANCFMRDRPVVARKVVATKVVELWCNQDPPGRFVEKKNDGFVEVHAKKAIAKLVASQRLREKVRKPQEVVRGIFGFMIP
jgi:hypothetical protein